MNAVEIEEAVSALASAPFDAGEFPYAFLAAFGNKDTTIKRLRSRSSNASDVAGGVLQRSNIHMSVCATGAVGATLGALRLSPKTTAAKAKFVLATDGVELEAEDLASGETIACAYGDFNVSRFYMMAYVGNEQGIAAAQSGATEECDMVLQLGALRDALIDAGANPVKADKAAEELAGYENRLASIDTRLTVLTWMAGTNVALTAGIVVKLFLPQ